MVYLPHWPIPHTKKPIDLGLERILELMRRLGSPHKKLPPVIHVAGTNGKGSTIAYLKCILESAGYKVHRYISPHIRRYNERINIAGDDISDDFLYEVIEETRVASGDLLTTFFEGTTAAAFLAFSKVPADILLVEVGMGGRLDATNVLESPIATIITPISDDHMEYLGDTIAKIAREKAGIIKQNSPCVVGWQPNEEMDVICEKAIEVGAPLYACGKNWNFARIDEGFQLQDLDEEFALDLPKPSLYGIHQLMNAATAAAAVGVINAAGFEISYEDICTGLQNAVWPARMQKIENGVLYSMLPAGFELWVDGAHNNGGAQMISATIANKWQDKPTFLINGRTGNRDIEGFLKHFAGKVEFVCGVKVRSEPLGEVASKIVDGAIAAGNVAYECDSIADAIKLIISKATSPSRVLICGSLYLAADVMLANKEF